MIASYSNFALTNSDLLMIPSRPAVVEPSPSQEDTLHCMHITSLESHKAFRHQRSVAGICDCPELRLAILLTSHVPAGNFFKIVSLRSELNVEPLVYSRPSRSSQQAHQKHDHWDNPCGNGEEMENPARPATDYGHSAGKGRLNQRGENCASPGRRRCRTTPDCSRACTRERICFRRH